MTAGLSESAIFEHSESEVRSYCRSWPVLFDRAKGSYVHAADGERYLDFFVGAGTLSYGHNNSALKRTLVEYIERDGLAHGLDVYTAAKGHFLRAFRDTILRPRQLPYKVMFPGPAGTNAVEAALKLARKIKGRELIASFEKSFHGMSLGSLAVSGATWKQYDASYPRMKSLLLPFDDGDKDSTSAFAALEQLIARDLPAAVIVETVQGEGGINVARSHWLRELQSFCQRHDMLLIVDDIQAGCGRTGPFFSFEEAGIVPDIVTVSKALSGYGLPLALTLFKPELDVWKPGEHNGTFRGNNHAFVTATAMLRRYWTDNQLEKQTLIRADHIERSLREIQQENSTYPVAIRGRGAFWGLDLAEGLVAKAVSARAFELGLLVETSGPRGEVVKLLPALTATPEELEAGLDLLARAVRETINAS